MGSPRILQSLRGQLFGPCSRPGLPWPAPAHTPWWDLAPKATPLEGSPLPLGGSLPVSQPPAGHGSTWPLGRTHGLSTVTSGQGQILPSAKKSPLGARPPQATANRRALWAVRTTLGLHLDLGPNPCCPSSSLGDLEQAVQPLWPQFPHLSNGLIIFYPTGRVR